jgi:hypothetical protein
VYIRSLAIDGFGVCSDLRMESLAAGLNVIHGPRASGKTTVVDFLRTVLYGFDPETRARYTPQDSTRRFGGRITLSGAEGQRVLRRHDDGRAGDLQVEYEGGRHEQVATLAELWGHVPSELLERVFSLDFERPARLDLVLDLAERAGFDLQDRATDPQRASQIERELADARQQLAHLSPLSESWEQFSDRRQRLIAEIQLLESRDRQRIEELDRERTRRSSLVIDLERQLADLQRDLADCEAAWARLLDRRRGLDEELAELAESGGEPLWREELRTIDVQLERWRATLCDLAIAKNGLPADPLDAYSPFRGQGRETHDPRRQLQAMEAIAGSLQQQLARLHASGALSCACRELRVSLEDSLRQLRDQIYQACHALNIWQSLARQFVVTEENRRFERTENELRESIRVLTERRQRLLEGIERPRTTLRPDHHDLCECVEHPQLDERTGERAARREALLEALRAIDDELQLEGERRARLERHAGEVEQQLIEARGNGASPLWIDPSVELRSKRLALGELDAQAAAWDRSRELMRRVTELEEHLAALRHQSGPSVIFSDASAYLRELSGQRWRQVTRDSLGQVWVDAETGSRSKFAELAEGVRDQVHLSVCLALAEACRARGTRVPMVLNAPFSRYSETQIEHAVRLLQKLGAVRQILCFTRDDHAVRVARATGVPVGALTFSTFIERTLPNSSAPRPATPTTAASLRDWTMRRQHQWDAEEFPGELSDRSRHSRRHWDGRSALETLAAEVNGENRLGAPNRTTRDASISSTGGLTRSTATKTAARTENRESRESRPRFFLNRSNHVVDAPTIGPSLARKLAPLGVRTISDLLDADAETLATRIPGVKASAVRSWQQQAELVCRVPELRGHDAQILVALEVTSVEQLANTSAVELWKRVERFLETAESKRILRGAPQPDLAEVTQWIEGARQSRTLASA